MSESPTPAHFVLASDGLLGVLVAFTPVAAGWEIPAAVWNKPILNLDLTLLPTGLFPVFVACGIVGQRCVDRQAVIKRSITYVAVFAILSAAYGLILSIARWLGLRSGTNLVATLAIAALFQPLRDCLQHLVDRLFFRAAYEAQRAIEEAAEALTTILDLQVVLAKLEETLLQTMHPRSLAILLADPEVAALVVCRHYGELQFPELAMASPLVRAAVETRHILTSAQLPTPKRHSDSDNLQAVRADLLVPLFVEDRLIGIVLLDEKRSETAYNETDVSLLWNLARKAALAIANAQEHRVIHQRNESLEERFRQCTAELEATLHTLKQTQAQLLHNEKMASVGILAAGMAHEINNPTTIVHGHLELLAESVERMDAVWRAYDSLELPSDGETLIQTLKRQVRFDEHHRIVPELIATALHSTQRIRQIIADLRAFASDVQRDVVPSDKLTENLRATASLVESHFKGRIRVALDVAELPTMAVRAGQINQVVSNLLINGGQATEGEGTLGLQARIAESELVLTIKDQGSGIPPDVLPKIFDPFFTTKPIGEGMGMGLAISYALVKANGGRFEVTTEVGEGTTFAVYLPIVPVESLTPEPTSST